MKSIQNGMRNGFEAIREINMTEKRKVESKKNVVCASIAGVATVAGAIVSVVLGGPIGFGLFAAAAEAGPALLAGLAAGGAVGGGIGGFGLGLGTKRWLPRKLFGEHTALKKELKRLKEFKRLSFDNTMTLAADTATPNVTENSPANIATMPNNATSDRIDTISNTASTSDNIEPTASTSEQNTMAYEFTTPANRHLVAEFVQLNGETNYYDFPLWAVDSIRGLFSNFRFR